MTVTPETYQRLVIARALELYAKTGIKANSSYTPKRMIAAASALTGKKFKARAYLEAAAALRESVQ